MSMESLGRLVSEHETAVKWAVLGAVVVGLEVIGNETLSNGVDKALERPWARYAAIGGVVVTAAHLLNLPEHFGIEHLDPFRYMNKDLFYGNRT